MWGAFPVIVVLSYSQLSGLISLAWSTVFAAIFFLGIIAYRNKWQEFNNRIFWKYILGVVLFNGILFYSFYYIGLEKTTAGNASLIGLTEILTSYLFFNLFRKEHISKEHKLGALLMFLGALIVLFPNFSDFNIGDFFLLFAMFFGPIGNFFQQKVRKVASAETLLFGRYLLSAPFIFLLAYSVNKQVVFGFSYSSLILILVNGLVIFGLSKFMWVEAIHRLSVTKAIALSSFSPIVTLLLAWIVLEQPPSIWQLTSFVPLFVGIILLTDNLKFKEIPIS